MATGISDEWDFVESLAERDKMEDKAEADHIRQQMAQSIQRYQELSDAMIRDYEAVIKIAVDAAVQKVIDGLSVELDTEMGEVSNTNGYRAMLGLKITIKVDSKEVSSSWLSLKQLKADLDL